MHCVIFGHASLIVIKLQMTYALAVIADSRATIYKPERLHGILTVSLARLQKQLHIDISAFGSPYALHPNRVGVHILHLALLHRS